VTKISEPLDGIYNSVPNFGNLIPSAAKAIIFGKKVWMLLLPIIDPISGTQVNKLLLYRESGGKSIWWASMQDVPLTFIQFQEIDSILTAWGTDGTSIYPLFQQPSVALTKILQTRLFDSPGGYQFQKTATRLWVLATYYNFLSANLTVSIDNENPAINSEIVTLSIGPVQVIWTNDSNAVVPWTNNSAALVTWFTSGPSFALSSPQAIGLTGVLTGMTITTQAADMALISAMISDSIQAYRG